MGQNRKEFGDWQTDYKFALYVCSFLKKQGINPKVIVEPTCGKGNFIKAALDVFSSIGTIYAIDTYKPYIDEVFQLSEQYSDVKFNIYHDNIFNFDFSSITESDVLFIGNPPWVTTSKLGEINSSNIPAKSNFKGNNGCDAITGKGNFDIAEYILLKIIQERQHLKGKIAFLVKNNVIKNLTINKTYYGYGLTNLHQFEFDSLKEFNVSVNASLFLGEISDINKENICKAYNLYSNNYLRTFGLVGDRVVSNVQKYNSTSDIDGFSPLEWRSGLKHDCAKVMELTLSNNGFTNGFGEEYDLELDDIYPLIKSSDIKKDSIAEVKKHVIVTQHKSGDSTDSLAITSPALYRYLLGYSDFLDGRKSSIYKGKPRFSLFGIGEYSFSSYKVVVSGLYKQIRFSLVAPIGNKPVMLDDTCYSIGFENLQFAEITRDLLNSSIVKSFIESISFSDAKRVISKDVLMRIDLIEVAMQIGYNSLGISKAEFNNYLTYLKRKTNSLFS
ncbi:MAG: SAM-dependent methyltransferase [Bacteroidales bacterium]